MTQAIAQTGRIELAIGAPDYPILNAYMRSRARVTSIIGPLGSGKTVGSVQRILKQMAEQPPNAKGLRLSRWLAVRNTRGDVMSTTAKDFLAIFDGLGDMRYGGDEPPVFFARFALDDGTIVDSEMIFLGLDRDDGVRRLRGYQVTGVWLNEAKELQKAVVDMADLRHGRYPTMLDGGVECGWHGMLLDCNAPDTDHWMYRLAEEQRPEGWEFYRQPGGVVKHEDRWVLNPAAENLRNLPPGYYDRALSGKADGWIRVMLANEYAFHVDGRPVHPEYVDAVHGARAPIAADDRYPLILGVDFGRTPAAIAMQYLEHRDQWVWLDELCGDDMSAAIFGPILKRWIDRSFPGLRVRGWGDPAGDGRGQATEDTPLAILRAHGIPIEAAPSNVAALRRAAIAGPCTRMSVHGPGLLVSPKCKIARKGLMGGYQYRRIKVSGDERYTDEPDKNMYSHPVEAGEYGMLGGGEHRVALAPAVPRVSFRGPRQEYAEMED